VIVIEPSLPDPGVYVELHVATPLVPFRLHAVNDPDRVLVNVRVPVGVVLVPGLVSETVTEHEVGVPARRVVGEQLTTVEVVLCVTVRLVVPVAPLTQLELARV